MIKYMKELRVWRPALQIENSGSYLLISELNFEPRYGSVYVGAEHYKLITT